MPTTTTSVTPAIAGLSCLAFGDFVSPEMTNFCDAVNEALTVVSPQSAPNESTGYTNSMSRDELRQPLRKRSLKERLWARRPSPLLVHLNSSR